MQKTDFNGGMTMQGKKILLFSCAAGCFLMMVLYYLLLKILLL